MATRASHDTQQSLSYGTVRSPTKITPRNDHERPQPSTSHVNYGQIRNNTAIPHGRDRSGNPMQASVPRGGKKTQFAVRNVISTQKNSNSYMRHELMKEEPTDNSGPFF